MTSEPLYVSLHIPKTGGTSFIQVLKQKFGERLQRAYNEREGWPVLSDPACIHGHGVFQYFMETVNAHPNVRWITFLRDPLRGAISGYFMAKRSQPDPRMPWRGTFTDRGLETWLTNAGKFRMVDQPNYNHNRYSKWFEKRPIGEYDFVGITERFDESLLLLYRLFDWEPVCYTFENRGGHLEPDVPEDVIRTFRELNAEDYRIYDTAVERLGALKRQSGPGFEKDLAEFREAVEAFTVSEQARCGVRGDPRR